MVAAIWQLGFCKKSFSFMRQITMGEEHTSDMRLLLKRERAGSSPVTPTETILFYKEAL
jgi:hypothetical protein